MTTGPKTTKPNKMSNIQKTGDIRKMFQEVREEVQALTWEGTFQEYLNMVIANPALARLAHARIYDMIQWAGVYQGPQGRPRYKIFADELFGLDRPLEQVVRYFHAASRGLEVKKRILLLLGPPASGKSTIVGLIKRCLEKYSRSEEGNLYAIKGCPMQEDPLHLVPEKWRQFLAEKHGIHIEGDLCPRCRFTLTHEHMGDISKMMVSRVILSDASGIGMGTFVATSPEAEDMARLVGSVDLGKMSDDRHESSGRVFRLDGELEAANRGIMEFTQMFKSDDRFLTVMLSVSQEQQIKLGSYGYVHADEVVVGISNEEEYNIFVKNKQTEALLDRLIMVKVPYNLEVSREAQTFRKILAQDRGNGVHIAPLTLPLTALLSVMSRLEPTRGGFGGMRRLSLVEKAKLYDGQFVSADFDQLEIEELQEDAPGEGMTGISPRYVVNRLAHVIITTEKCLLPLATVQSLIEGINDRAGLSKEEQDKVRSLVPDVLKEYKQMVVREVQKAAVEMYDQLAIDLFNAYVKNLDVYCGVADSKNNWVVQNVAVDEQIMRRTENGLGLRDSQRYRFRQHIYQLFKTAQVEGVHLGPESISPLRMAIENALFPSSMELKEVVSATPLADEEKEQRLSAIRQRLTSSMGYCNQCAEDLLAFGCRILQGKNGVNFKRGRIQ